MARIFHALIVLLLVSAMGCAPALPRWKDPAAIVLDTVRLEGADQLFPVEYLSAYSAFEKGVVLLKAHDIENADSFFHFAYLKGDILEKKFSAEKIRVAEEAKRRIEEEKLEMESQRAAIEAQQSMAAKEDAIAGAAHRKVEKIKQKERVLPVHHTVKRGETLPQIAAQVDVYDDYRLWPLLYKANRDQISNPKHVWPGQVLRIPRHWSRDDVAEARRYSQEKPI